MHMAFLWSFFATFWWPVMFVVIAFILSLFLGLNCLEIFDVDVKDQKSFPKSRRVQQIWFNFTGSLFGWGALWCLLQRASVILGQCSPSKTGQATWSDFALAFVAFVGVSGYLPYTAMGIVEALKLLVNKFLKP